MRGQPQGSALHGRAVREQAPSLLPRGHLRPDLHECERDDPQGEFLVERLEGCLGRKSKYVRRTPYRWFASSAVNLLCPLYILPSTEHSLPTMHCCNPCINIPWDTLERQADNKRTTRWCCCWVDANLPSLFQLCLGGSFLVLCLLFWPVVEKYCTAGISTVYGGGGGACVFPSCLGGGPDFFVGLW